jgi:L-fuconolactonase
VARVFGHKTFDRCPESGNNPNGMRRRPARAAGVPSAPRLRGSVEAPVPDFAIVDTHVHLYDPAAIAYPWMAGAPPLNSPHGSGEYTAAIGPVAVEKLVFVEVDAGPGEHLKEARWVESLARSDGRIAGIVASMPLEDGAAVEADIAAFAKVPLARGVRRLIQGHVGDPGWCLRPAFLDGVRLVAAHRLHFEICIYHPQMQDAIALVRRCPEVDFVLDHIGKPGIAAGLSEPWRSDIRELAALPNVVCKLSGVVTEADHSSWTYDDVAPYMSHVIDAFGFDRLMFGGDWPVLELAGTFPQWVGIVDRVTAGVGEADLRKLYRDTAVRVYRL